MSTLIQNIRSQSTVVFAAILILIIAMMVLPIPSWLLDFGLALSFTFAISIFTLTLFIERPLDFSSFPAILLASLLLRLSLNISSTKLIIGQGHTGSDAAGSVIQGFANFVMGGNIFIGLVVFTVLVIVNFMVITKGAGRMAEVGARFALDAMPGKQMAIDSDLSAGAISHKEAHLRRTKEQEETAFLGSLDGVSKFMKGDAIAGILITFLNLIAGIGIGILVHNVSFSEAIRNYSVLTVGDGLVSQIPAVIISIAAGILLSKGRGESTVDSALISQFSSHPVALGAVAGIMAVFAIFPGLPFIPFMVVALALAGLSFYQYRIQKTKSDLQDDELTENDEVAEPAMGDVLELDEIIVELSADMVAPVMENEFGFDKRVQKIRNYIATECGFILPPIRLSDNVQLAPNCYRIKIHGAVMADQKLKPNEILALVDPEEQAHIPGTNTHEPVFKAPARWVKTSHENELKMLGVTVITPVEVLATHLMEIIQNNFEKLLTRRSLRTILDSYKNVSNPEKASSNRDIIESLIPEKVSLEQLQSVLRLLLSERISIRNFLVILETIAEAKGAQMTTEQIADYVRKQISYQFIGKYRDEKGRLPIVKIGGDWEAYFQERENQSETGHTSIALTPNDYNRFAKDVRDKLDSCAKNGTYAVVTTHSKRRRFVHSILAAKGVNNPILSYEEIPTSETPLILGTA